jgi:hypothetical protein
MKTIRLLIQADKFIGAPDNLENAQKALLIAKSSTTISSQGWKLKDNHIIEIRETFVELTRIEDENTKKITEQIIKDFEEILNKLKGDIS